MSNRSLPRPIHNILTVLTAALALLISVPAAAGASPPPRIVSPGGGAEIGVVDRRCPTFDWVPAQGASKVELEVHRLSDPRRPETAVRVLAVELPGGAHGWTPSLGECLEPGFAYAWTLRASSGEGVGDWSEPGVFEVVVPRVREDDLARALEVVRSYLEQNGHSVAAEDPSPSERAVGSAVSRRGESAPKSTGPVLSSIDLSTVAAAIRGELDETTGETAGVVGVSNSPDGAGVVAANADSAAGADLVLEGTTHGGTDTVLTQSGIDRSSASNETFDIGNSGSGGMTLTVDGQPLAAGTIDTAELEDDAVTGPKIAPGAVGASHVAGGAVSGGNGGQIVDGTVDSFDLALGSVGNAHIIDGSVRTEDVLDGTLTDADVSIVAALDGAKLADDSVGGDQLADDLALDAALTVSGQPVTFTDDVAVQEELPVTNNRIDTLELRARSTGTAADGIGTGLLFRTENDADALVDSARIVGRLDAAASGSEASALGFWTGSGGLLQETMTLDGAGDVTIQGDLAVNGSFDLPALSVDTPDLANGAVTTLKLDTGAVTGGTGGVIDDDTVNSFDLMDGGIKTADFEDGAVTGGAGGPIADGTITGDDLQGASIGSAQLEDGSVVGGGGGVIADDTVDQFDLATDAVGAAELADGSVDAGAIQSSAVGSVQVADGSLTGGDLSPAAGIGDAQVDDALTVVGGSVDASPVGVGTPAQGHFTFLLSTGNSVVGSSTSVSETLDDPGFAMGGDDLFVAGSVGVEGTLFTDGGIQVGTSTSYGNGEVNGAAGQGLAFDLDGGDDPAESLTITAANALLDGGGRLTLADTVAFEGATDDDFEVQLGITDPTADRTITLPDESGTLQLAGGTGTFTDVIATGKLSLDGGTTKISAAELNPLDGGLHAGEVSGTNNQHVFAIAEVLSADQVVADSVFDTLRFDAPGPALSVAVDGIADDLINFRVVDDGIDGDQLADTLSLDAPLTLSGADVTVSDQNLSIDRSGPAGGLVIANGTQNGTLNNSPSVIFSSFDTSDTQRTVSLQQKLGAGLGQRLSIEAGGSEVAWVDDGGGATFDTVEATSRMDATNMVVSNFMRLEPIPNGSGPACTAASTGRVYYDAEEGMPCFCNGSGFVRITDATTACSP